MGNKLMPFFYPSKSEGKTNKLRGSTSTFVSTLRRSASLRSLRRMSWMSRPHLDCRTWLTQLELTQYVDNFSKFGGVEDLLYYDENKIIDLGVEMSSHLSRIMASLNSLKEKYEKNQKLKVDLNPRASLIEVEEARRLKLRLDIDPDVVLRHGSRSPSAKQDAHKREGALLSPSEFEIAKMSFDKAKTPNKSEESSDEKELKNLLEWELSLDSSDLRSHAWYHGSIPRLRAEEVVAHNECFIVRDCISQPGNYVLTCRWRNNVIHVVIQKTTVQPNTIYEHVQFVIEDEAFDSVPDLVTAYVGGRRPVTMHSGAIITNPINRTLPLSFYLSKYEVQTEHTKLHGTLSRPVAKPPLHQRATHPYLSRKPVGVGCTVVRTTSHSPPRMRRESGSSVVSSGHRPSSGVFEERCNSSDGVIGPRTTNPESKTFSSQSLPRRFQSPAFSLPPQSLVINLDSPFNSKPVLPDVGPELQQVPPPKPSRVPSIKVKPKKPPANPGERIYAEIDEEDEGNPKSVDSDDKTPTDSGFDKDASDALTPVDAMFNPRHSRISEVYNPSGSDSGNGSGDSVQTSTSDSRNRDSQVSLGDNSFILAEDDSLVDDETLLLTLPDLYPSTSFDLENFSTLLLPAIENKPLDFTALKGIRNMLNESGSRILAAHLTRCDLDLLNGSSERDLGLGVTMGIELITLPQGSQLRKDLIERTECLKLLVAISILKIEDIAERAELISRWIQVAVDTKTAMGNLYGFTGIMLGLCIPEIQRLSQTWMIVRRNYTDSAFKFESKLRSTLKSMNECMNPQAPNTIVPHLLPFVLLCERDLEDIYSLHNRGDSLLQWESQASDYGLQMLYTHLQEGRTFTQNLNLYKRNAELVFGDVVHMEELILDMFRTEFHLKFLFGSKAAYADSEERMQKFQKVIETLSEFCEPTYL